MSAGLPALASSWLALVAAKNTANSTTRISFIYSAPYWDRRFVRASMRQVIPHDLAILHNKANALELGDVGDGIARDSDEICKFSRLDCPDAVCPAQHFCRIDSDGTNHIERRHSGLTQVNKSRSTSLPARASRIKPAHI